MREKAGSCCTGACSCARPRPVPQQSSTIRQKTARRHMVAGVGQGRGSGKWQGEPAFSVAALGLLRRQLPPPMQRLQTSPATRHHRALLDLGSPASSAARLGSVELPFLEGPPLAAPPRCCLLPGAPICCWCCCWRPCCRWGGPSSRPRGAGSLGHWASWALAR